MIIQSDISDVKAFFEAQLRRLHIRNIPSCSHDFLFCDSPYKFAHNSVWPVRSTLLLQSVNQGMELYSYEKDFCCSRSRETTSPPMTCGKPRIVGTYTPATIIYHANERKCLRLLKKLLKNLDLLEILSGD